MDRTAIYIGSFNPPHVSHVLAAAYVLSTQDVDALVVVPTFQHAFGKALEPFEHRFAMCQLAFGELSRATVSTVERDLGGESRTLYSLQALARANPTWSMRLVIGSDVLAERHKWLAWEEVEALAPPIVLVRQGFPAEGLTVSWPEIAARDVRAALGRGEDVSEMVPRTVRGYIEEHSLYR